MFIEDETISIPIEAVNTVIPTENINISPLKSVDGQLLNLSEQVKHLLDLLDYYYYQSIPL